MNDQQLIKLLLLLRLIAFMALVYLGFGLLVEWRSRKPDSKLKAFARLLCSPLTRPVAALSPAGLGYRQLLGRTTLVIAGLWLALVVASEIVLSR
jgi:preprotein translocase subunit SecG